jgi:hypothetical protein
MAVQAERSSKKQTSPPKTAGNGSDPIPKGPPAPIVTGVWRRILVDVTSPLIWAILFPAFLLDLFASVYQTICFPIYGITKVRRREYIIIDRHRLSYLKPMEKLSCAYCGYVNGLMAYVGEIAARTERFWCPIRHAVASKRKHSQEHVFVDYGDEESLRQRKFSRRV